MVVSVHSNSNKYKINKLQQQQWITMITTSDGMNEWYEWMIEHNDDDDDDDKQHLQQWSNEWSNEMMMMITKQQ